MTTLRGFVNDLSTVAQQYKQQQALKIAGGSIPNMETYHRQCGQIEGMDKLISLAREMLGKMESEVDNDGLPEMPKVGEA